MRLAILTVWLTAAAVISLQAQPYIAEGKRIKAKADTLYEQGNRTEAERGYVAEANLYRKHADRARLAQANTNVAVLQLRKQTYAEGIRLLRESLVLLPATPTLDSTRFRAYSYLGLFFRRQNRFDSCQHYYDCAAALLDRSRTLRDYSTVLWFYQNQGVWELDKANYQRAESFFRKAATYLHFDSLAYRSNAAIVFQNIAYVLLLQRRFEEALSYFDKALAVGPDEYARYYIYINQATCYLKLNKREKVGFLIQESNRFYKAYLAKNKSFTDAYYLSSYYKTIGLYAASRRAFGPARRAYRQSIAFCASPDTRSEAYGLLGETTLAQGNLPEALAYFEQAVQAAQPDTVRATHPPFPRELFLALVGKAGTLRQLGTTNRATLAASLDTYLTALRVAEQMRRSYQTAAARLFFTESHADTYPAALDVARLLYDQTHDPRYLSILFQIAEQGRAATLTNQLREADLKLRTLPPALLAQERALQQQLSGLQQAAAAHPEAAQIRQQLTDTELAYSRLQVRFEQEFPNYYQLKYAPAHVPIRAVQTRLLDPETVLLSYTLLPGRLLIQAIGPERVVARSVRIDSLFFRQIRTWRAVLSTAPQGRHYTGHALAAALYTYLIEPIGAELRGKRRLIILRDGELNLLPFEVLAPQPGAWLLRSHTISYGYSAGGLLVAAQHHPTTTARLAMAPFGTQAAPVVGTRQGGLGTLPRSEGEVAGLSGEVLLGKRATREAFLAQHTQKRVIHLATHAITDDREPLRSFVAFYPNNARHTLPTEAIYDLDLRQTSLVVLSACQTGVGRLQRGEGMLSLARAFAYAGARAVLTTGWNAHDEATAYLSARFHAHLNAGLPTDEALRQAKLDFLGSDLAPRYDHPYFWANFSLIGPAEVIGPPRHGWGWWVLGTLLAGVGLFWAMRCLKPQPHP
jgi:CHAT domain-containing protein